ncbi:MAG: DUF4089 domain-containing protein [Rhodoferax sp.]|uniref:DUF4089 domain-containing protein n=1 Tax=Rhodoferax sp. TaxID=50421 RepID=UPI00273270A7|nr:DUF4089 domain-containing protein [Rhodoferax sp.]MDP2677253.1 DUF4089 domain-containing protein [Rhodoferax sp.]
MNEMHILAYVKASAMAQGLALDEARAQRVASHLARTAHLAQLLEGFPLSVEAEPAELYQPLPFSETPHKDGAP